MLPNLTLTAVAGFSFLLSFAGAVSDALRAAHRQLGAQRVDNGISSRLSTLRRRRRAAECVMTTAGAADGSRHTLTLPRLQASWSAIPSCPSADIRSLKLVRARGVIG